MYSGCLPHRCPISSLAPVPGCSHTRADPAGSSPVVSCPLWHNRQRKRGCAGKGTTRNSVRYSEQKALIKSLTRAMSDRDDYHLLPSEHQVILIRMCTGHNRFNAHMNRKFSLAPSPTCACGQEDQTVPNMSSRDVPSTVTLDKRYGLLPPHCRPNCMAAKKRWRRQQHSSLELDWLCNSERKEGEEDTLEKEIGQHGDINAHYLFLPIYRHT